MRNALSKKPLKIVMLISRYPPVLAGLEMACQRLSRHLAALGHSVKVLTEKTDSRLPNDRTEEGVQVVRWNCPGRPPFSSLIYCLKAFRCLWNNPEPDVLHAHMLAAPAVLALLVGRLKHKPVLIKMAGANETGDFGTSRRSFRGLVKLWLFRHWATDIVAPSVETMEEVQRFGPAQARIHLIPNGVDTRCFVPPTDEGKLEARRTLGLPMDQKIALYVGRWAKGKGLEILLEVFEKGVREGAFPWVLLLVVGGDFSPPSETRSQLARLGDRVRIEMNVANPVCHYQASDLALLLSEGEGLSNFLLEAMACGVPTMVTEPAAVAGVQSSIVLPGSEMLVARCLAELRRLAERPEELRDRGRRLHDEVVQRFSLDAVGDAYESLYEEMIQRGA